MLRDQLRRAACLPFFVEFGARKPGMLNSAMLRVHCHWDGILMDSQPGETPHGGCPGCPGGEVVRTEFVTAENVVELFTKHGVPKDVDLLTIDTDFNDYWIWRALLTDGTFRPRVVALDFNPDHELDQAKVVKYDAFAEWDGSVYTVGSLLAYTLMANAHGYSFAYALEMGAHAFFIREDLLVEADRRLPLRAVRKHSHPPDGEERNFADVLYDYVPGRAHGAGDQSPFEGNLSVVEGSDDELQRRISMLTDEVQGLRRQLGNMKATERSSTNLPMPDGMSEAGRFYKAVRERFHPS